MQSANQEPVEFLHPRIDRRGRWFFFDRWPVLRLRRSGVWWWRRVVRTTPEHVRFESLERRGVRLVIQFVRIRPDELLDPVLKERFLFKFGEELLFLAGSRSRPARRLRRGFRRGRVLPAKHHSLIGAPRIVNPPAHFHFHFMHDCLSIANLRFDVPKLAQERSELPGPPSYKARPVFALKPVPGCPRVI